MTQAKQITQLQSLIDELSAELAELVDTVAAQKSDGAGLSSIQSSVVELITVLRGRKDPEAPKITVQVSPTPITVAAPVVQILERVQASNYRFVPIYDNHDRITSADIFKVDA